MPGKRLRDGQVISFPANSFVSTTGSATKGNGFLMNNGGGRVTTEYKVTTTGGVHKVTFSMASPDERRVHILLNGQHMRTTSPGGDALFGVKTSGGWCDWEDVDVGTMDFGSGGACTFAIRSCSFHPHINAITLSPSADAPTLIPEGGSRTVPSSSVKKTSSSLVDAKARLQTAVQNQDWATAATLQAEIKALESAQLDEPKCKKVNSTAMPACVEEPKYTAMRTFIEAQLDHYMHEQFPDDSKAHWSLLSCSESTVSSVRCAVVHAKADTNIGYPSFKIIFTCPGTSTPSLNNICNAFTYNEEPDGSFAPLCSQKDSNGLSEQQLTSLI